MNSAFRQSSLVVENANETIFTTTPEGLITTWNHAAQALYHYSSQEIVGQSLQILFPKTQEALLQRLLNTITSGNNIQPLETPLLNKEGTKIICLINAFPIQDKQARIVGAAFFARDYRSQKQVELQAAIQLRVASILAESNSLHNAAQSILKVICELLGFSEGEMWALNPETLVLRYVSSWSRVNALSPLAQASQALSFAYNEGLPGYIWATKQSYWSNAPAQHTSQTHAALLNDAGINTCFGFPIVFDEDVFGVLLFYGINIEPLGISLSIIFEIISKQIGIFFKRRRMEKDLLELAEHDTLTGLANKFYIGQALQSDINKAREHHTLVAFLYLDLDHFKDTNDALGHLQGDLVLQEVASRLQNTTRDMDTIGRFGGDEFAVILPEIKKKKDIDAIAKKILTAIEFPFVINNRKLYLTASMGISVFPDDGDDIETLYTLADISMYKAKKSGRNNYQYASPETRTNKREKLALGTSLHKALANHEFILHYQPIVDIQTNAITGFEALLRWESPSEGLIFPDAFIPQLEESHLIVTTGLWAMQSACKQMKQWHDQSWPHSISVNISVKQFNPLLIQTIHKVLTETGLSPDRLIIEVTESMLMRKTQLATEILDALSSMGVRIAIDDFGTGYSSFAYLKDFNVNILKIDKSFIADLSITKRAPLIIKAIIDMAHALGLRVIAEGVETKEQLLFLKEHGCDEYQGHLYSRALSVKSLESTFPHGRSPS